MLGKTRVITYLLIIAQSYALQDAGDDKCRAIQENPLLRAHKSSTPKKVLIATPLKNAGPALDEFAEALKSLTYPKELMSLAFLISDTVDDTAEVLGNLQRTKLRDFAAVKVFKQDFHYQAPEDRHAFEVQAARRGILAKSRNVLIEKALTDDTFAVLWLDVDITGYPTTLVQDLLAMGRPVVAPHVLIGPITYDKNSWRETRPEEAFKAGGPEVVFEGYPETALAGGERIYMDDLRNSALDRGVEKNHQYAVCIDGVGTAVLLVQARVHREGVLFPETPYKKRLESEGFGLLAKDRGFQPCGLPFYEVYHYDEWKDADARRLQNGTAKPPPTKGNASKPIKIPQVKMICKGKAAECKGKGMAVCKRLQREGKCQWGEDKSAGKAPGKADKIPGECVGKKGQPECDDKEKMVCKQLMKEKKCKWLMAPADRRTPTGKCEGEPECMGKSRRVCHRMRMQEGKCRYKPAPENEVKVGMKLKNLNPCKMNDDAKEKLKTKVAELIAKKVELEPYEVNVTLSAAREQDKECLRRRLTEGEPGINVDATIDMEEQIAAMEAENEGTEVDLVSEMKAIKSEVQAEVGVDAVANEVLAEVFEIEGVIDAAEGDITISEPETEVTTEAATKAPDSKVLTDAPAPAPSPGSSPAEAPAPEPLLIPSPTPDAESKTADDRAVDASVHKNVFMSLVIATVAVVIMQ